METSRKWQLTALGVLSAAIVALAVFLVVQQMDRRDDAQAAAATFTPSIEVAQPSASAEPALPADALVFFAGDSLSAGWYATTEEQGFRPLVQDAVRSVSPEADFVGAYQAGYTVQQVADEFDVPEGADVAVVELGTNDVTKWTDPEVFAGQYGDYLETVTTASPDASLLCLGSFYHQAEQSDAIDAAIEDACTTHGGEYIDLTGVYSTDGMRGPEGTETWLGESDNGHPNDAGHQKIAALVTEAIGL